MPYRKTKLALREYEYSLRIAFENEITPHEVKQTPSVIKSITRKAAKEEHAFAKNQTTIVEELENFARNEETWTRSSREYLLSKVSMLHAEASCLPNQEEVDPAEFQFQKKKKKDKNTRQLPQSPAEKDPPTSPQHRQSRSETPSAGDGGSRPKPQPTYDKARNTTQKEWCIDFHNARGCHRSDLPTKDADHVDTKQNNDAGAETNCRRKVPHKTLVIQWVGVLFLYQRFPHDLGKINAESIPNDEGCNQSQILR